MTIMIFSFIFFISLFFGSFYNVVALRTLSSEGLSYPPSHCTSCNHRLGVLDLFPVLSYMFLGGKCRYCKEKISPIYPFGEFLTATSYTIIFYKLGFTLETWINIAFITILIVSTITDLKETIVPDRFIVIGVLSVLALRIIKGEELVSYLIAGALSFGILFLILIFSNGKMGGADVKLYLLIGLAIGFKNSMASLFFASFVALIVYLPSLKNKEKKLEIPFVPFITIGVLITYLFDFFNLVMI